MQQGKSGRLGSTCATSSSSLPRARRLGRHRLWLAVAVVLCIHVVCWRATEPLRRVSGPSSPVTLARRSVVPTDMDPTRRHHATTSWSSSPLNALNEHGTDDHDDGDSLIDWRSIWERADKHHRPALFVAMLVWLVFLFAFVGIAASDFFCPNLSTIASRLGLSESVAGVTFLAFSNGSPDVFSTFAALSHDSGSLAIGELIGAASFIVSVVSGTMCLIKPFRVAKHTFLRDVGFFTVAVTLTLAILYDSHIRLWEALGMVGLYAAYVAFVAVGSWWHGRKERKAALLRAARDEYAEERGYRDEPDVPASRRSSGRSTPLGANSPVPNYSPGFQSPNLASGPSTPGIAHPHMHMSLDDSSFFAAAERGTPVTLTRQRSSSANRPTHRRVKTRSSVRPSLLGAIEFRDVVNSLREDSTARTLAIFGGVGDDLHTHATVVGTESAIARTSDGNRPRAQSHTGAIRLPDDDEQDAIARGPPPATTGSTGTIVERRSTWAREPSAASDESRPGWGEDEDDSDTPRTAQASPIIDLSEGVENPWKAAHSRGTSQGSLHVDLPPFPSQAAATRMRSAPVSLRRTPSNNSLQPDGKTVRKVPSILLTTASGEENLVQPEAEVSAGPLAFTHHPGYRIARAVFLALFPSLQDFREKSWVGRATAILCVPAILVLNLTLPVVDTAHEEDCASLESREALEEGYKDDFSDDTDDELDIPRIEAPEGVLVDTDDLVETPSTEHPPRHTRDEIARRRREEVARALHHRAMPHAETEDGVEVTSPWIATSPAPPPKSTEDHNPIAEAFAKFNFSGSGEGEEGADGVSNGAAHVDPLVKPITPPHLEVQTPVLTRWLTAIQCTLGPVFCVSALMAGNMKWWYPLVALGGGLVLGMFAFWVFEDHRHPGRIVLCFVGFFVAMVWILTIVTEVVAVLQTIGHIFGLSDAILGLTVFAVGNSLGDLVANATVARMGFPSMAIAACFGGPMLNILLGIGLSGSYMVIKNEGQPLHVAMSRTLVVSGVGLSAILVATLVAVPMNGYWMDKRIGAALIGAYTCLLTINILVEVFL